MVAFSFTAAPLVEVNQTLNDIWNRINGPLLKARQIYDSLGVPRQYDASEIRGSGFDSQLRFLDPFRPGNELTMMIRSDQPRYQQGRRF